LVAATLRCNQKASPRCRRCGSFCIDLASKNLDKAVLFLLCYLSLRLVVLFWAASILLGGVPMVDLHLPNTEATATYGGYCKVTR
jgi:hypothetical protein